jgi:hypothetical protein
LSQLTPEHLVVGPGDAAKLDAPDVDSVRGLLRVAVRRDELQDQSQQKRTNEAQATACLLPHEPDTDDSMTKDECGSRWAGNTSAEEFQNVL